MNHSNVHDVYKNLGINSPALHQQKAWNLLSEGKAVLLRAPTGSGKTEAIVLPFLDFGGKAIPSRLLYALPLRSLANQMLYRIDKYANILSKLLRVRLQHGERSESVLFAADAIVATIDQLITSYACTPLTLPLRHGNIPAGAVMSSFVVFDEMHLFDPELGLQATRLICERLHRIGIPYAVLSATLPDSVVEFWRDHLGANIVEVDGEFVQRQVTIEWKNASLNPDEVNQALKRSNRILAVCNTVDRAVELYRQIEGAARGQGYECNLLHSRFLPDDRKRKEDWVIQHFGKNARPNTRAILVATQVVEVGLDISADLLLTEVAPVDALIQRAGRVARWGGDGAVWVYNVANAAPYNKGFVDKTRELIQKNSGVVLDWPTAMCWINQILNEPYHQILHESNVYEKVIAQLSRAAFEGSRARAEAAVRDVNTVEVTIHDNPQTLGKDILHLPTISVHIGIAKKWAKEAVQAKVKVWRVEVDKRVSDAQVAVTCESISDKDIWIGDRLVFPTSILSYSANFGLQRAAGGSNFQPQADQSYPPLLSTLQQESWVDHSIRVSQEIDAVLQQESHAVSALASILGTSLAEIEKAAKLAAVLHDLGKLNKAWQERAGISSSASPADLLAHTDGRNYNAFPPHATVSAYALWPALVDGGVLPPRLAKTVCFAIAHHHSVRAKDVPPYSLHPAWQPAVEEGLQQCGLNGSLDLGLIRTSQPSLTNLRERFPPMEYECLYTTYVLLSRWLRLADRIATGGSDAVLCYEDWFGRL